MMLFCFTGAVRIFVPAIPEDTDIDATSMNNELVLVGVKPFRGLVFIGPPVRVGHFIRLERLVVD